MVLTPSKVVPLGLRVTEGTATIRGYRKHGGLGSKHRNALLFRGLNLRLHLHRVGGKRAESTPMSIYWELQNLPFRCMYVCVFFKIRKRER